MSQALSFHEAEYTRPVSARTTSRSPKPGQVARRRKALKAPARVPMLDWPTDLYGDNASLAEQVMVDFVLQCDPSTFSQAPQQMDMLVAA
jgi:hypothetical protein